MGRQHGITTETTSNLILDSGAIYKNYGVGVRTITLASVIATDAVTVTINGSASTFTGVASNPGANQFEIGISDSATATNLAAKIDALTGVTAAANNAVVTVTGDIALINFSVSSADTTFTIATNGYNSELVGATRGGSTFTVETEYKTMEFDGARGPVKGGRRITGVTARMTVNLLEHSTDNIKLALTGSTSADYPVSSATHDEITRSLQIASTAYLTNIAIVAEVSGDADPVVCGINNAICDGSYELKFADKDEAAPSMQFTAHFPTSDLDTEPWFIRYPKMS